MSVTSSSVSLGQMVERWSSLAEMVENGQIMNIHVNERYKRKEERSNYFLPYYTCIFHSLTQHSHYMLMRDVKEIQLSKVLYVHLTGSEKAPTR